MAAMSAPQRLAELLLSRDPDVVRQGFFLLDSTDLPESDVVDALIGPLLFERFADPVRVIPVPLELWDRLPGLGPALRAARLPDAAWLHSPLVMPYIDAFPDALGGSLRQADQDAWAEAEALRARLGLPLPFVALIEYTSWERSPLRHPYDALRAVYPDDWAPRLRRWMASCAGEEPAAQGWLAASDEALTFEHVRQGAAICAALAGARVAEGEDPAFGGAAAALQQIEGCRQEGALWSMLSDSPHRWPLSLAVMGERDGFAPSDWVETPAVAFWIASPQAWRRSLRAWALDCAEHVVHLCSREDARPRQAIKAARALLEGEGDRAAWEAACAAAEQAQAEALAAERQHATTRMGDERRGHDLEAAALGARGACLAARGHALQAAQICERAAESGAWAPPEDEIDWQRRHLWACLRAP